MIKLKKALNFIDLAQKGTFCLLKAVFKANKKDMKPFHIDRELECPILSKNVLSCLRTSYPV